LKVHATDRFFAKSFARMNGTLEIVFSREKTTAMTGNLMQSLEVIPIFFEIFPSAPGKPEQADRNANHESDFVQWSDSLEQRRERHNRLVKAKLVGRMN
jgi:hypothetical protein